MKFTLLTVAGVLSAISQASAITVVTPWASSVWTSGGHGNITWTYTSAEANLKCDISLLNGDITNANTVAQITDPSTPVDCSVGAYDMYPLNDFASGQYWIRIGQSSTNTWSYSAAFTFQGNGSSSPASVVATATTNLTGTAAAASSAAIASSASSPATTVITTAVNVTGKASSSASSTAPTSTSTQTNGASSFSVSGAAVALGAIAAIAFNL